MIRGDVADINFNLYLADGSGPFTGTPVVGFALNNAATYTTGTGTLGAVDADGAFSYRSVAGETNAAHVAFKATGTACVPMVVNVYPRNDVDASGVVAQVTLVDTTTDVTNGVDIAAGQTVATVTTLTGHTAQTGDNFARIGATGSGLTSLAQAVVATEERLAELDAANLPNDIAAIPTTPMRGTDGANTTTPPTAAATADAVWDEARTGHVGAGSFGEHTGDAAMRGTDNASTHGDPDPSGFIDASIAAIPTTPMRGTDNGMLAANGALETSVQSVLTTGSTGPWTQGSGSGGDATEAKQDLILGDLAEVKGTTFAEATDSLEALRDRGDAAWITGSGGDATDAKQDTILTEVAKQATLTAQGTMQTSINAIPTTPMRGTDGANTVVPGDATEAKQDTIIANQATTQASILTTGIEKNSVGSIKFRGFNDAGTPTTGLVFTGTRIIDGAAQGSVSGTIAEIGASTWYRFTYAAADNNGDDIAWTFSAANAKDVGVSFQTVS